MNQFVVTVEQCNGGVYSDTHEDVTTATRSYLRRVLGAIVGADQNPTGNVPVHLSKIAYTVLHDDAVSTVSSGTFPCFHYKSGDMEVPRQRVAAENSLEFLVERRPPVSEEEMDDFLAKLSEVEL